MKARILTAIFVISLSFIAAEDVYACAPSAVLVVEPNYVWPGKTVTLDASYSTDVSPGSITKYEWDFTDNGSYDYYETSSYYPDGTFDGKTTHVYESIGIYTAKLRVTDNDTLTDTDTCIIDVNSEDLDNDGLPGAWESLYGLSDSNCADADEDIDSDGYNNLSEYLHESDPNDDTKIPDANFPITIYVPSDVNSIQRAIDASIDGDTIIVSSGTYYELIDFIGKAITVTSTDPNDWTVIALTTNDANDPSEYVVTFQDSEDSNSILKGFVITGGDLGIYCNDASPTISNCVIKSNGSGIYQGAGIFDSNGASPTVTNCFFIENDANNGGAIYNVNSSPTFKNCVIGKNTATQDGGAIYDINSSPSFINCTLAGNHAGGDGGGIYNDSDSSPLLINCIIWGNDANSDGDDVYNSGSADPNFIYCDVKGSGGSGSWDPNFGTNGTGNVDVDPNFTDPNNPSGTDGIYGTIDDGLQLYTDSAIVDAAKGSDALSKDIIGRSRNDFPYVSNTGSGDPNYADLGAYESPTVIFVDIDATGSDDGTSWSNAFNDLQDALADTNAGDEIWVADGIYKPTSDSNTWISFELSEGVGIYGGFAGTESNRFQRNWTTYQTVLSGDINEPNDTSDNTRTVVIGADGAILDGFVITDGNCPTSGGGMYNNFCSVTVSNCLFTTNNAKYGGAIANDNAYVVLLNCIFANNTALSYGGAIDSYSSFVTITNCVFVSNVCENPTTSGYGGAIDNFFSSFPIITNCTFYDNHADYGGGISNFDSSDPKLTNCIFWDNTSDVSGDEVYNDSSDPTFSYCDIEGCGGSGGGWDPNFGTDGGGNIDTDPCFIDTNTPAGSDGVFWTIDDGLRLMPESPCVDAANGDVAPSTDILGHSRIDVNDVNNTGTGSPNYADLGTYEYGYDSDGDGMPDDWELVYGFDPFDSNNAGLDGDGDELTNLEEYQAGTDPGDADSDDDGMPDGWEDDYGLDPLDDSDATGDPDSDGLSNLGEYQNVCDPGDSDTDDDGMPDGWEVGYGLYPNYYYDGTRDADMDSVSNAAEYAAGLNPNSSDSDSDGMSDGWEIARSYDPCDPNDADEDQDSDGYSNVSEYVHNSNPNDVNDLPSITTIKVPSVASSIQRAIDWSIDGDTIVVSPGTYYESIDFNDMSVTLSSTNPDDWSVVESTIIDANYATRAVLFNSGEDANSILTGFTIRNASSRGIECVSSSSPIISKCVLTRNNYYGAFVNSSSPVITNCKVINNGQIGILVVNASAADIRNNLVYDNAFYGIVLSGVTQTVRVRNTTVFGNTTYGLYYAGSASPEISNSIFWGHTNELVGSEATYSCIENVAEANGIGNITDAPNFIHVPDFVDTTYGNGTTTTIKVADANLYDINDVIEYDDDGLARTVTDANTTSDIVTFLNDPLGANSTPGVAIHNWGPNVTDVNEDFRLDFNSPCINAGDPNADPNYTGEVDIDGEIRVRGEDADMGSDEGPVIWYVDIDANGTASGFSWTDAFTSIQDAIDASLDGDEIVVAEGTYYESINFRGRVIQLTSTDPEDSNTVAATIIDANDPNDSNDGTSTVVYLNCSEDAVSVLTGFTIQGGASGIYCSGPSNPVITYCVIRENTSYGVRCASSSPIIGNCVISGNEGTGISGGSPTIESCTIVENGNYGVENSTGTIINCIIWDNGSNELYDCNATYSCIQDSNDGVGNFSYFPYFEDSDGGDYHLESYSLCIDVGDPNSDYSNEPSDPNNTRINLGAYGNTAEAAQVSADLDSDFLPDPWELLHWASTGISDSNGDQDSDNLNNLEEYRNGLDPNDDDTDGDGLTDDWELTNGLNPRKTDTDSDGIPDNWENDNGLDPLDDTDAESDVDLDGLTNLQEYNAGADPNDADSDDDGMPDDWEYSHGFDPSDSNDAENDQDSDNYSNVVEFFHGSDPNDVNSTSEPNTITVPTDVSTIQGAIDVSIDGDVIEILAGTYYETINFNGKSITLRSTNPNFWGIIEKTIIDANDNDANVVTFNNGEDANSILEGLTLTGGKYGVFCDSSSSPTMSKCIIEDNSAHGIYCLSGAPLVTNSIIRHNNDDGIYSAASTPPTITNNIIYENNNGIGFDFATSAALIRNNTILYNDSNGIYVDSNTAPSISNCILWANDANQLAGCTTTYSCIENGNDPNNNNTGSDPCLLNVFEFVDVTTGADSNTTIKVADANLYDVNDVIEYDDDNISRTITDVNTTTDIVTFANDPLDSNSATSISVHNWGSGVTDVTEDFRIDPNSPCVENGDPNSSIRNQWDIYGGERLIGEYVDIGADEAYRVCNSTRGIWYATIQSAINAASKSDSITVNKGVYHELLDFKGKSITLSGSDPNDWDTIEATVISASDPNRIAVTFAHQEDANTHMTGLTITNGATGVYCSGAAGLTISNCVIKTNSDYGIYDYNSTAQITNSIVADNNGIGIYLVSSDMVIANCTIADNNSYGIDGDANTVINCILWNNGDDSYEGSISYSRIENADDSNGNTNYFPYFVDANGGDYHLQSYSPCIDTGEPNDANSTGYSDFTNEPNSGGRINMGAFGNTVEASAVSSDTDSDGLPDDWELLYWPGTDSNDANDDADSDDLTNMEEYIIGTDPNDYDSDGDGMGDGWESNNQLDPLGSDDPNSDIDGDGLTALQEYTVGSDPNNTDSDGDHMDDYWEYQHGLDPADANDADGNLDSDAFSNLIEFIHGSDPNDSNSLSDPNTFVVPTDFNTIQGAIDVSIDGDEIVVLPGVYTESIDFSGKSISITGTDPNDWFVVESTIIDANDCNEAVVFNSSEDSNALLTGLTLLYADNGIHCSNSTPTISWCIIEESDSNGIYVDTLGSPTINNCMIGYNAAAGIYVNDSNSITTVTNCWIYLNEDGIVFNDANSASVVRNNTIVSNTDDGIYVGSATDPNISNCIIWDNEDDVNSCAVTYSCIEDGDAGQGNISSDPLFIDDVNSDYRILRSSPCKDKGDPNQTYDANETDIEGHVRDANRVDIGADEICEVHNTTQDIWYRNIQDAIDDANSDDRDVIAVYAWIYYETIDFSGKSITIRSIDPNDWSVTEVTVLDGNDADANVVTFDSGEDSNSILQGITITGGKNGIYCDSSSSPTVTTCFVTGNNSAGVRCVSGSPMILRNKIGENSIYGIYSSATTPPTVKNCLIYKNEGGIVLDSATSVAMICNNTIADNYDYGINVTSGTEPNISNCILWNNDANDLVDCNASYSCIEDVNDSNGTGNITADPLFTNPDSNNYCLNPLSPCLDAGDPHGTYGGEICLYNNIRMLGDNVDIGMAERQIIYVNPTGHSDGESWRATHLPLKSALAAASFGDHIWVVEGIYVPGKTRAETFNIPDGVELYGGFPPIPDAVWDDRDPETYETILSGDTNRDDDDLTKDTRFDEDCYHVVILGDATVLDGFTITRGNANGGLFDNHGGGIVCYYSSPTINNCLIEKNNSSGFGGGMFIWEGEPTVADCNFYENSGAAGGGVMILGHYIDPTFVNCIFNKNTANGGGGMATRGSNGTTVSNCIFTGNQATSHGGGGMHNTASASPTLTNCVFFNNNSAGDDGGAIHSYILCNLLLTNCTFYNNKALNGDGGGIRNTNSTDSEITNCIFWYNEDKYGYKEETSQISQSGGILDVKYSCIQDEDPDDEDIPFGGSGKNNTDDYPEFAGTGDPFGPDETFGPDKIFGTYDDGLCLSVDSDSCIDTGDNTAVPGYPDDMELDITGHARIFDGDDVTGAIVDMGAYEFYVPRSDTDRDGLPDSWEIQMAGDLTTLGGSDADADEDGLSDLDEYVIGTDPTKQDTDGDNMPDGWENNPDNEELDPLVDDADGDIDEDGLTNLREYLLYLDNPDDNQDRALEIEVPEDVSSIQTAIDVSEDGDTIIIAEGRYYENLSFQDKYITIQSSDPENWQTVSKTIIDGSANSEDAVISISSSALTDQYITINGLTVRGGNRGVYYATFFFRKYYGNIRIKYCIITDNITTYDGGGLFLEANSANVSNCYIINNTARYGGGAYIDCHMYSPENLAFLTNCVFWNNTAQGEGGAIYLYWMAHIKNCTFAKNHAYGYAGGLFEEYLYSGTEVANSIFWGNTDTKTSTPDETVQISGDYTQVTYCCIQDELDDSVIPFGGSGSNNTDDDPRFAAIYNLEGNDGRLSTSDDGLRPRLLANSPCLDKGNDGALPLDELDLDGDGDRGEKIPFDLVGVDRIIDGDRDGTATVDMGAYESARIWYVNGNADGANNGKSWEDAYRLLENALENAVAGDEIWVAQGIYTHADDVPFTLEEGVSLYGGFYGTEESIAQRRLEVFRSILSEEDLVGEDDHLVIDSADGALLDGFTISGGKNTSGNGGGISISSGEDTTLQNCFVVDNEAEGNGAGVYVDGTGGGVELNIINCVFAKNNTTGSSKYGGGLYCNNATVKIQSSTFYGNVSDTGGGISAINSTLELQNNIIYDNSATIDVNEINNESGNTISYSFCDIKNSNGSGSNWDSSLGTDAGDNIATDPAFVSTGDPNGPDNIWGTPDDGLKLISSSPCIDNGKDDVDLLYDIAGLERKTTRTLLQQGDSKQVDIGAFEYVYSELPFMTSFEENQGCQASDSVAELPGWSLDTGSAVIYTATFYDDSSGPTIQYPYNYLKASASTTFSRNLSTYNDAYNYVRISCIPSDDTRINVMCGADKVASVWFNTDGDIYILKDEDENYENSNVDYSTVEDQCRIFLDNTTPDYSYEDTWVEIKIEFDWTAHVYKVWWKHYNTSGWESIEVGGEGNFSFVSTSYNTFTDIEFVTETEDTYLFSLNRISITSESGDGGVFGDTEDPVDPGDVWITEPSPDIENPLEGRYEVLGSAWYEYMGEYKIKCCRTDRNKDEDEEVILEDEDEEEVVVTFENWELVDSGTQPLRDAILGHWSTAGFDNGDYLLKIEMYDDIGRLHSSGIITKTVAEYRRYPIVGLGKGQTLFFDEKSNIKVNWPGDFPFEFVRIYNHGLRNQASPMWFGWTHNHNIKLMEDLTSDWAKKGDGTPKLDFHQVGFGYIWLLMPTGARMFIEDDNPDSTEEEQPIIYVPHDGGPDYIVRTTSETSPGIFDLHYEHHATDGSIMTFETDGFTVHEDGIDWKALLGIDRKTDRFGNYLQYNWQTKDLDGDGVDDDWYITQILAYRRGSLTENCVGLFFETWYYPGDMGIYDRIVLKAGVDADRDGTLDTVTIEREQAQYKLSWDNDEIKLELFQECFSDNVDVWDEYGGRSPINLSDVNYEMYSSYHYGFDNTLTKVMEELTKGISQGPDAQGHDQGKWTPRIRPSTEYEFYPNGELKTVRHCMSITRATTAFSINPVANVSDYSYQHDESDNLITTIESRMVSYDSGYMTSIKQQFVYKKEITTTTAKGELLERKTISYQNPHINPYTYDMLASHFGVRIEDRMDFTYGPEIHYSGGRIGGGGTSKTEYLYEDEDFPLKPTSITETYDDNGNGNFEGRSHLVKLTYDDNGNVTEKRDYMDLQYFVLTEYDYHDYYSGFKIRETTWQGLCYEDQSSVVKTGQKVETRYIYGDKDGNLAESSQDASDIYLLKEIKLLAEGTPDVEAETVYTYEDDRNDLDGVKNNQLSSKTNPQGNTDYYEYDAQGFLKAVWNGADDTSGNPQKRYYYNDAGLCVLEADYLGKVTERIYDDFGNVTLSNVYEEANAISHEFSYGGEIIPYTVNRTLWLSFTRIFGHNSYRKPTQVLLPYGGYYTHWGNYRNIVYRANIGSDPSNIGSAPWSTVNSLISPGDNLKYYNEVIIPNDTYDPAWWKKNCTFILYDSLNRPVHKYYTVVIKDPPEMTLLKHEIYAYDGAGNKIKEIVYGDTLEKYTAYEYDLLNRMVKKTEDPSGLNLVTRYGYDAVGNKIYTIDPEGYIAFVDYDNTNRKTHEYFKEEILYYSDAIMDIDGTKQNAVVKTEYAYYDDGSIESVTKYDYDDNYDGEGDELAYTEFTYDKRGRIETVKEKTDIDDDPADYATTTISYSDIGYDSPDPLDTCKYQTRITDACDQDTYMSYEVHGKPDKILYPSGDYEEMTYDGPGQLIEKAVWDTSDVKQLINYAYDNYGKLQQVTYPNGGGNIQYQYTGRALGKYGRIRKIIDNRASEDRPGSADSTATTYKFEYLDHVTSKILFYTVSKDQGGEEIPWYRVLNYYSMAYDRKTSIRIKTYSDAIDDYIKIYHVTYDYDMAGRLESVKTDNGTIEDIADYSSYPDGTRQTLTYSLNGSTTLETSYKYNPDNALKYINATINSSTTPLYRFDATAPWDIDGFGRLLSADEKIKPVTGITKTHDQYYSYDMRSQLLSASISNINSQTWTGEYSYQKDGNIEEKTVNDQSPPDSFEYDTTAGGSVFDSDIMTKAYGESLDWDENGQLTTGLSSITFAYNWDGKLRGATIGSDSISLKYDPMGNRVYKQVVEPGPVTTTREYIVDISGRLPTILCEINPDPVPSSLTKTYIYSDSGQILCQRNGDQSATKYFYINDRLGSVRQVVDASGTVKNHYTYKSFGELFDQPGEDETEETITNPFKFTGQWYDDEINQYYLRARMYDPALMRFTGRDPVKGKSKAPLTLHVYLYCINNPVNRNDPSGTFSAHLLLSEKLRRPYLTHVGKTFEALNKAGGITGFDVMVTLTDVTQKMWYNNNWRANRTQFVEDLLWMFTNVSGRWLSENKNNLWLDLDSSGFAESFQDGHRGQVRHFIGSMAAGFYHGVAVGGGMVIGNEIFGDQNLTDIVLGYAGLDLGSLIAGRSESIVGFSVWNQIDLSQTSSWMQENLGQ